MCLEYEYLGVIVWDKTDLVQEVRKEEGIKRIPPKCLRSGNSTDTGKMGQDWLPCYNPTVLSPVLTSGGQDWLSGNFLCNNVSCYSMFVLISTCPSPSSTTTYSVTFPFFIREQPSKTALFIGLDHSDLLQCWGTEEALLSMTFQVHSHHCHVGKILHVVWNHTGICCI